MDRMGRKNIQNIRASDSLGECGGEWKIGWNFIISIIHHIYSCVLGFPQVA